MAFSNSSLAQVSVGAPSLPKQWVYKTTDALATVVAADYFGAAPAALVADDLIEVKCSEGSATLRVTAHDAAALTSTVKTVGNAGVWVDIHCSGYGTAGAVGYGVAPIAGTITKWKHILTTVVDADVVLNIDIGGTNATGSITIASAGVAVGDIDSANVTAGGAVTENALIKVESDGGGTAGAGRAMVLIVP